MDLSLYPLWNADPVLFSVGSTPVRIYSVMQLFTVVAGYITFHFQMVRAGHGVVPVSRFALWMFIGIMVGARLGHCLFYEPEFYLANPVQILNLSRGGVSSHGATAGIFITLFLYAKRFGYRFLEVADRMAPAIIWASSIRLGNFFNSEVVGREYYGALAVRFQPYAEHVQRLWERANGALGWEALALPRHPVQLYEFSGLVAVGISIFAVDRKLREQRPLGLLAGIFCSLYFSMRFIAEFAKETLDLAALEPDSVEHVIRSIPATGLTTGQILSLPFVAIGVGLIARALHMREPAAQLSRFDEEPDEA
jgi:prolipoprotein diacylglyceryl transferase